MEKMYRPYGKEYLHVNDEKKLKIDNEYVEYLKSLAKKDQSGKCTMCLHNDIREHVHEMINIYPKNCYIRPHNHPFKVETKIMIEGKLLVIIFDETGVIQDKFIMEKNGIFTFRLDKGITHTNIPLTDVVFHEVIAGPYTGTNDNVFPEWAPEPLDAGRVAAYMEKLGKLTGFSFVGEYQ